MLNQLVALLEREDEFREIPAMAFFSELLMCADLGKVEERVLNLLQRYVRHHSAVMRWLVLRGLLPVSERATMARKMHLLLPDLLKCLQDADRDIRLKALMVLRNVFSYTDRQRAQPTTLQLMEMLLPLFDDEASQLRQLSILLFKDVMETVGWSDKWRMKQEVQRSLLPLFFHMSDERRRVAQASRETLLQAAQLLQWEQLRHLAKTGQTGKISECMLARYRSRAEDYVGQSLPFLQDPQASLREAAVRFIGLAARHMRPRSEEKLQAVRKALQPLQNDSHPCVSALATQTILMLRPPQENSPSAFSLRALRSRLRRSWGRWHVLLGCCSVGAELEQQC